MGEFYDARMETTGWTKPNFDDAKWDAAILASENGSAPATFYEYANGAKPGDNPEIKGRPIDLGFHRPAKLEGARRPAR